MKALSAKISYAVSLYEKTVAELGPRAAYAAAIELAGLTAAERTEMRNAIAALGK